MKEVRSPLILSTPSPGYTCPTPSSHWMTARPPQKKKKRRKKKKKRKKSSKKEIHTRFPVALTQATAAPRREWTEGTCLTTAFHHMTKLLKVGRGVTPSPRYSPVTRGEQAGSACAHSKIISVHCKKCPPQNHIWGLLIYARGILCIHATTTKTHVTDAAWIHSKKTSVNK